MGHAFVVGDVPKGPHGRSVDLVRLPEKICGNAHVQPSGGHATRGTDLVDGSRVGSSELAAPTSAQSFRSAMAPCSEHSGLPSTKRIPPQNSSVAGRNGQRVRNAATIVARAAHRPANYIVNSAESDALHRGMGRRGRWRFS